MAYVMREEPEGMPDMLKFLSQPDKAADLYPGQPVYCYARRAPVITELNPQYLFFEGIIAIPQDPRITYGGSRLMRYPKEYGFTIVFWSEIYLPTKEQAMIILLNA